MKNILIIVLVNLDSVGGVERYNNYLINILRTYYRDFHIDLLITKEVPHKVSDDEDISYFYAFQNEQRKIPKNIFSKCWELYFENRCVNKKLKKILKDKKYDLILNSSGLLLKTIRKKDNYFFIQHNNIESYLWIWKLINSWKRFFITMFQNFLLFQHNTLKKNKNLVVYDDKNALYVKKYFHNSLYVIPLSIDQKLNYKFDEEGLKFRKNIIYLGRINNSQKNILDLVKINDKLCNIDFYGQANGSDEIILKEILSEKGLYKGIIPFQDLMQTLNKYKFLILYSNYEGFSFSLVEALSCGLPIIVKNTFLSASYLCNEKTGLLLDKNSSIDEDIKQIEKFYNMNYDEYLCYAENAFKFYIENLNFNKFKDNWLKIFDRFLEKK